MAAIRAKDTGPEVLVRRMLHSLGYRYRLHVRSLPGRPDLVFPGRRRIIEIRGCFWHRHGGCPLAATPRAHAAFWQAKLNETVTRDARNLSALEAAGWSVLVVWECETRDRGLRERLVGFLGPSVRPHAETIACHATSGAQRLGRSAC